MAGPSATDRMSLPAKIIAGLFLFVLVGAAYFMFFYTEVDAAITAEKRTEAKLQGDLTKAEDAKAAYQKDLEEKSRKQLLARENQKALPDEPAQEAFLAAIQGTATSSGIDLRSYEPRESVVEQFYARVPMGLTIRGRYHQIARFFYVVSQLDRIINIEDIEMKVVKETQKSDEVLVDVKCLATAFRSIKPAAKPTPAPAPPAPGKNP